MYAKVNLKHSKIILVNLRQDIVLEDVGENCNFANFWH